MALSNTHEKFPQPNKNLLALQAMKRLGFPMTRIRAALLELNGLKVVRLQRNGIGQGVLYSALRGQSQYYPALRVIANALGLSVEDLFDDDSLSHDAANIAQS